MNRSVIYAIIVALVVVAVGGAILFNEFYVKGGTGEASQPLAAPELSLDENADPAADDSTEMTDDESAGSSTGEMAASEETGDADSGEMTGAGASGEEMAAEESVGETMSESPAGERRLYRITPEESQVMFELDEQLLGQPKHVVGTTDQVTGDVIVDMANPANSELGTIVINARTLTTDDTFRNRAIRSRILQSAEDAYEFIEFTPTALNGLPEEAVGAGDEVTFQIVGDLKIRDIVNEATFDATVTIAADDRLEGSATTVVMRGDYNLIIPQVQNVANVTEEVGLTITFVATEVVE